MTLYAFYCVRSLGAHFTKKTFVLPFYYLELSGCSWWVLESCWIEGNCVLHIPCATFCMSTKSTCLAVSSSKNRCPINGLATWSIPFTIRTAKNIANHHRLNTTLTCCKLKLTYPLPNLSRIYSAPSLLPRCYYSLTCCRKNQHGRLSLFVSCCQQLIVGCMELLITT